jgi:hypothetical protein
MGNGPLMSVATMSVNLKRIHDSVRKDYENLTMQRLETANSHALSFSFDLGFTRVAFAYSVQVERTM